CCASTLPGRASENRRPNATARRPCGTRLLRNSRSGDFLSIVILQWPTRLLAPDPSHGLQALLITAGGTGGTGGRLSVRTRPFGLAEWRWGAAADPSVGRHGERRPVTSQHSE